jgi:L-ascorbate metabolism protein UlaG (beta-lactamase superfamily)
MQILFITLLLIVTIILALISFLKSPRFGKLPSGVRLERIKKSPNYKNGAFQNLSPTPIMAEDVKFLTVLKEFIFTKNKKPVGVLPSIKTNLLNISPNDNILVWFGHSSFFMQIDGKKILFDPIFSKASSPVSFTTKAFKGSNVYTADDIPEIDYLFISHDHWDHLDYDTLFKLRLKIKKVICGLGTGEHFEHWNYKSDIIHEMDWNEKIVLDNNFIVHTVPSRHFSGRTFRRNKTLWTSFVLETNSSKIFMGCDGGYDTHFEEIGKKFGGFDFAILENGQYNKSWKYIHMMPDQVIKAAKDLNAKRILPVHSCKFALANHRWHEPLKTITDLNKNENLNIITPLIGEKVDLFDDSQKFTYWWEKV